jgi:PAS domain S-box-containing protein
VVCCVQILYAADTSRVQLKWWHQFQFAGYYAADIKGFYKNEGLTVKLLPGDAQHNPLEEVQAGRAQFGISGSELLVNYAKGIPVVALGALFQHSPYVIISLEQKRIRVPSDLVGKTLMVSEAKGWVELQAVFLKEAIPLNSLRVITHSWKNTDLLNGKVDALTGYYSVELNQLRKLGATPSYIQAINYGIDFYGDILFSLKGMVDHYPERTSRFRKASFKGWEYAMTHTDEIADYILTLPGVQERGVTKADLLAEAEAMRKLILPNMVDIGHMNEGRWQHMLDVYKTLKLVNTHSQLDSFLYNEGQSISSEMLRKATYYSIAILLILMTIILYSISLRRSVSKRTAELNVEIEQRTHAQEQLRVSEERLEMATDAAGLGIWDWNLETDVIYFSDTWKTMLGYEPDELSNTLQTFTDLLHSDEHEMLMKQLMEHVNSKTSKYQAIIRLRTKDRRWKWILTVSKVSQRDKEGNAIRLSGIHLDIDDIKQKELEMQELSQELMNSNRELQQFAYITSHNLRAPVANLISLVKLFEQSSLSEKNRLYFQKINISIDKLFATLDDLNEILSSRVNKASSKEQVFFEKQLMGIIASISEEIKEKQAVITYDFSKAPDISYPGKVIDSVLLNLITNAIKYKKDQEVPTIHISTTEDGEFVILAVKDNGKGIDMDRHGNKIFGLYQRFHENTDGKGLGLYIIKNQVEALGGKIAVESIANKGSLFYVFLKKITMPYDA